jgi:HD superfamily phosphohydrolase
MAGSGLKVHPRQGERTDKRRIPAAKYQALVEQFVESQLVGYVKAISNLPFLGDKAGKEINDAVWGTVALNNFEVLILDSPILQRLKRVRQLGVVHWVYPCAGHSRLEHSIGALHQVQRLIDSLNRAVHGNNGLPPEWTNLLRLAALCHDVGHGLMSHVIENALKTAGVTDNLLLDLQEKFDVESCSLSEAAAYFILGSDAFAELVQVSREKTHHTLPEDWQTALKRAIIGKPIHDRWPLLQELISGPFDADKLDYMTRDTKMAGIPNITDIPRLVQKVRVAEVPRDKLPTEIGRRVAGHYASYFVQGILLSGGRTLDELMIARTLLFDKIYRHQKTRAVEAMVANAVSTLFPLLDHNTLLMLPLTVDDEDFIALTRRSIASRLRLRPEGNARTKLSVVANLVRRIRNRDLFVRAYAFSHTMPQDPFRNDPVQKAGLERLSRAFGGNPEERTKLLESIATAARRIIALTENLVPDNCRRATVHHYIALDPFATNTKTNEIARACLITVDGRVLRFRDDSAESSAWSNAYVMTRDLGYVFAAKEYATVAFLACEAVFHERYGIRTPPSVLDYVKVDRGHVDRLRGRLAERGFYQGKLHDLRPMPERLVKADVHVLSAGIADNLKAFQGYVAPGADGAEGVRVNEERILAWLRQFPSDEDIESALRMLQAIKLLSREEIGQALAGFIAHHPEFQGGHVCPLGGPRDSSSIITYYAADWADRFEVHVNTLNQALSEGKSPILFIDDFVGSGRQAASIMKYLIGEPYEEALDEDHGKPLSGVLADELRKRQLGFLFVYGDQHGKSHLAEQLTGSGLKCTVEIHQEAGKLPRAFDGTSVTYQSAKARDRFRQLCNEIGEQLLKSELGASWDSAKIGQRALGYGNQAFLVAFPYNVPTQTLTLLWCKGKVDGRDWMPLLRRRKKI